jgi:hypothetical protein
MFFNELIPLLQNGIQQPVAFFGGLCAGLLRLDLAQEPVKTWLDQQLGHSAYSGSSSMPERGNSQGPKSIEID